MRVVPIAAALWAAHALAQSPAPAAAPAPAPAPTASAPAPAPTPSSSSSSEINPAATPAAAPSLAPAPAAASPSSEEPLHWGLLIDAGIPDGAGASAVFRPMSWLRLAAGGTYNFVAFGVRGGVSVVPFYFPFSPSLNLEVGHFFAGDITPILSQAVAGTGLTIPIDNSLLRQVAYDYANAHLGFEFGLPRNFIFFIRLGISYIQTKIHGFQDLLQAAAGGSGPPDPNITAQDPIVRVTAPSLKLGLVVYF